MAPRRLAAVDAQTLWLAAKIPSDQFLVYAFAAPPADLPTALAVVRRRAAACGELGLRVHDPGGVRFPRWLPGATPDIRVASPAELTWADCLTELAALAGDQLDCSRHSWRLQVFPTVHGLPAPGREAPGRDAPGRERAAPGCVAVVQIAHALGDGARSAALAGRLFGRRDPIPMPVGSPASAWTLPAAAWRAARTHRQWQRDLRSGALPAPPGPVPVLPVNDGTGGPRAVRTLVRDRRDLGSAPVTTGVLVAVGTALAAQLNAAGADTTRLRAEVPMAATTARQANNHYGNVGVGLHPDLAPAVRAERITAELAACRVRRAHPATVAAAAAFARTPAALLRWGVAQFDAGLRATAVTGHTVVSSVRRGAADLEFGGAPVLFTTGAPALSPMMGLTHGVHGIGDTVALSVHAATAAIGDLDGYVDRLRAAWCG